jgi:diamine N-acetyltransferase
MVIRDATTADLPAIRQLVEEIWPVTYGEILSPEQLRYMIDLIYDLDTLKRQMEEEAHVFIMLDQDGSPAGFADYSLIQDPGIYKLHKIYLLPSLQGKGLGKKLIGEVMGRLRSLKANSLRLNVNRHNKALHFYERLGFRKLSEEDIDIGQGYYMNDYVMEYILPLPDKPGP